MTKYYKSNYFNYPIEVDNINWEIIISIIDTSWRKIIYSWYDLVWKNTESKYITNWILWWLLNGIPEKVLILWFWGWAYAKYIEDHISNTEITGVDIDETMFEIAKKELSIKTNALLTCDCLSALNNFKNINEKFDLIFIDIYWKNWEIPDNFNEIETYLSIKASLNVKWIISINFANYSWVNIWKYNKIHHFLKTIFWENYIHINWEKNNKWNIIWIYNLDKKYLSEEVNMNYLKLVKEGKILYDSNIIKNTYIEK